MEQGEGMMRKEAIALALAAALAGCSKPTPGRSDNGAGAAAGANAAAPANASASGNAAGANTAAAAATGNQAATTTAAVTPLNPGEWETAVEAKISGLPPQVAKMMAGHKVVGRHCVTPEEAARPKSDMFSGSKHKGCTGEQMSLAGGRIHAVSECKDPRGGHTRVEMDGQYGGDSYDVSVVVSGEQRGQSIHMESHTTGHRVAPTCSAAAKGPRSDDATVE
jgi:hypothetical protein